MASAIVRPVVNELENRVDGAALDEPVVFSTNPKRSKSGFEILASSSDIFE